MKILFKQKHLVDRCGQQLACSHNEFVEYKQSLKKQLNAVFKPMSQTKLIAIVSVSLLLGIYASDKLHLVSKVQLLKLYAVLNQIKKWGILIL